MGSIADNTVNIYPSNVAAIRGEGIRHLHCGRGDSFQTALPSGARLICAHITDFKLEGTKRALGGVFSPVNKGDKGNAALSSWVSFTADLSTNSVGYSYGANSVDATDRFGINRGGVPSNAGDTNLYLPAFGQKRTEYWHADVVAGNDLFRQDLRTTGNRIDVNAAFNSPNSLPGVYSVELFKHPDTSFDLNFKSPTTTLVDTIDTSGLTNNRIETLTPATKWSASSVINPRISVPSVASVTLGGPLVINGLWQFTLDNNDFIDSMVLTSVGGASMDYVGATANVQASSNTAKEWSDQNVADHLNGCKANVGTSSSPNVISYIDGCNLTFVDHYALESKTKSQYVTDITNMYERAAAIHALTSAADFRMLLICSFVHRLTGVNNVGDTPAQIEAGTRPRAENFFEAAQEVAATRPKLMVINLAGLTDYVFLDPTNNSTATNGVLTSNFTGKNYTTDFAVADMSTVNIMAPNSTDGIHLGSYEGARFMIDLINEVLDNPVPEPVDTFNTYNKMRLINPVKYYG